MFSYTESFDQPLDRWDVSNVSQMISMFEESKAFYQNLNDWTLNPNVNNYNMFKESFLEDHDNLPTWFHNRSVNETTHNRMLRGILGLAPGAPLYTYTLIDENMLKSNKNNSKITRKSMHNRF